MNGDKLEKWEWLPLQKTAEKVARKIAEEGERVTAEYENRLEPMEHLGPEEWLRDIR